MGFDKSPTNDKIIFITAIGTVAILFALVPLFDSYWDAMRTQALRDKIEGRENVELERNRREQAERLSGGSITIEQAVAQLSQGGAARPGAVEPRASETPDVDAVDGWVRLRDEAGAERAREAFEGAARERAAATARESEEGEGAETGAGAPTTPSTATPANEEGTTP